MHREERRRKFHDALLNMLYPPPSLPPTQEEVNGEPANIPREVCNVDHIQDELEEEEKRSSSSSGEQGEFGSQKLTRAQRKRLRKKKFSEAASHRRKIIGPLLPTTSDDGALKNEPQGVRHNAAEELDGGTGKPGLGEPSSCTNPNKVKNRRMAKRLAREKSKSSTMDNTDIA